VSCYMSGCISSYISSYVTGYIDSLLRYKEGDSVIDILIETGNNSREDVDRYKTNIDIGVEIGVDKVIDILIELGSARVGYKVCLIISTSGWGGFWGVVGGTRRSKADGSWRVKALFLYSLPLGLAGSGSRTC
jgi:hypothetical protein